MALTTGWLTRLTAFIKGIWEAFAAWAVELFKRIESWWMVVLGVCMTLLTSISDSLHMVANVFTEVLATAYGLFGGLGDLDQSQAFAGSPWPSTLSTINTFIPLKEGFAAVGVLIVTMGAILIWRGTLYAVLLFKRIFFNWL